MTRILGIDPGSRVTGFGVIDFDRNQAKHVASGCIHASGDHHASLQVAHRHGRKRFRPQVDGIAGQIALEEVQHIRSAETQYSQLGQITHAVFGLRLVALQVEV